MAGIYINDWMISDLKLSGNELLVFAAVYTFSQDGESEYKGGYGWMSAFLGISRNTVINVMKSLEDKGLIDKESDNISGVWFNRYRVNREIGRVYQKLVGSEPETYPGGIPKIGINRNRYNKENTITLSHSDNKLSSFDSSIVSQKTTKDSTKNQTDKIDYVRVQETYNEICKSLPKCIKLTPTRKSLIKQRWNEYGEDVFTAFRKAEASDFLSGRNGGWNGANFDWVLNASNIVKILEGNYDNERYKPEVRTVITKNIKAAPDYKENPGMVVKKYSFDEEDS